MQNPPPETVSKIDAARRQLETAIELWFNDKDQVSIHALSYAAYEVIHFVSAKKGRTQDLLLDSKLVRKRHKNQYRAFVTKFGNFFKHAKHDPDETIEFEPLISELFIMFACVGLNSINIPANKYELAFTWWFAFHRPGVLTQYGHDFFVKNIPVDTLDEIRRFNKREFLDMFLSPPPPPPPFLIPIVPL